MYSRITNIIVTAYGCRAQSIYNLIHFLNKMTMWLIEVYICALTSKYEIEV